MNRRDLLGKLGIGAAGAALFGGAVVAESRPTLIGGVELDPVKSTTVISTKYQDGDLLQEMHKALPIESRVEPSWYEIPADHSEQRDPRTTGLCPYCNQGMDVCYAHLLRSEEVARIYSKCKECNRVWWEPPLDKTHTHAAFGDFTHDIIEFVSESDGGDHLLKISDCMFRELAYHYFDLVKDKSVLNLPIIGAMHVGALYVGDNRVSGFPEYYAKFRSVNSTGE